MCVNSDCLVTLLPIGWFWGALSPLDATLGWTALNYFWIFLFYMLISLPEMIFWIMSMAEVKWGHWLFNMWVSYPGLYGSWIFYFFTFLWPIVQMGTLTNTSQPGYTNAAVQCVMGLIGWMFTGLVHVLGYEKLNRKYLREYGYTPNDLPTIAEDKENQDAAEEKAPVEFIAAVVDAAEEPVDEDAVDDAVEDATDEADDAFAATGDADF